MAARKSKRSPVDLRAEVKEMRTRIARGLGRAPPKDAKQTALHDGWRVALKRRTPRMRRELEDLLKARRWDLDEEGRGLGLKPTHWEQVIRHDLTDLCVGLAGARRQYETLSLRWKKKTRFGAVQGRNVPPGGTKALDKQRAGAAKTLAAADEAQQRSYRATMKKVLDGWNATHALLGEHLDGLQALTARLQAYEEARLDGLRATAPTALQQSGAKPGANLRLLRLDGEAILLDSPAAAGRWAALLRKWNLARKRVAKSLA